MKISFIRGAYLNNFEGQNYDLPITGYSSLFPLDTNVPFPLVRLPSIADLQKIHLFDKPIKYITNRTLGDSQVLFRLENHIMSNDIAHIADPHYYYSYQAAQLREKGFIKKLVSTWWETIPFNNESTRAKKRIKKYTMSQIDLFITYTNKAKECLLTEGVPANKIKSVSLGVDLARFYPHTKKKKDVITILFVGRLVEEKGIEDLYVAYKSVLQKVSNAVLHVIGEGPFEKVLRYKIKKDGIENKVTIEKKPYKEMPKIYLDADILCVPSKTTPTWEEQYGMVFIEAMASGLPIVSYATGSIPDVVGEAGLLVPENDVSALANRLVTVVKSKDLSLKLGTIGRERAENYFDAKKTAKKINTLYSSLIDN